MDVLLAAPAPAQPPSLASPVAGLVLFINHGAGMAYPIKAANFIRANTPFGTDYAHPVLSAQDAFDVAAFVDSQPRPHRLGNERDFPDRALKPGDPTYPPLLGRFPPSQHPTGSCQPIRQWRKDDARSLRRKFAAPGR